MATAIAFGWQVENVNGTPVSGARIYFFAPGTTTPRTTWTNSGLTVPAAHPVEADAAGWFNTYLSSELAYDVVIKSADDSITYQTRTIASGISGAQPADATLTAIAALAGTAGDIMEWTGTDTLRVRKFQIETYAAARLLTGLTVGDRVYINGRTASGDGGEGWFRVAAGGTDRDGLVLVMADSKALIREDTQEGVDLDIFGIVPGTVTVADFDTMVTSMSFQTTRTVMARGGIYVFGSKPTNITTALRIEGTGESITTFERGYSEGGGDSVGFLEWRDANASNSKLSGMLLRAGAGTTGGTMVRFYATTTSILSWPDLENVVVSPESGAYAWALDIDGIANTTGGSQGIRSVNVHRSQFFGGGGAATNAIRLRNVVNSHLSDVWTNGNVLIGGGGASDSNTQRLTLTGFQCLGTLTIENCDHVTVDGTMDDVVINGTAANVVLTGEVNDLTIASGATGIALVRSTGTITNNANSTFTIINQNGPSTGAAVIELSRTTVNMNTTADQAITIRLPPGFTRYGVQQGFAANNSSANLATAQGGIYTDASKAGTQIVASSQVFTTLTGANLRQSLTSANTNSVLTDTTLWFSLTTAAGVAGTAEVILIGYVFT
jgi:hypothetical protein